MPDPQNINEPLADVIDAEIVDAEIVPVDLPDNNEAILDINVDHLSAKGGAVGGLLLAVLGLAGMSFSSYSFFNVLLAIGFSVWGLKSPLRKTAIAGLLIALAGLVAFFLKLEN